MAGISTRALAGSGIPRRGTKGSYAASRTFTARLIAEAKDMTGYVRTPTKGLGVEALCADVVRRVSRGICLAVRLRRNEKAKAVCVQS